MPKRTFQPNRRSRVKTHGFRARMKTKSGAAVLSRRRAVGRKRVSVSAGFSRLASLLPIRFRRNGLRHLPFRLQSLRGIAMTIPLNADPRWTAPGSELRRQSLAGARLRKHADYQRAYAAGRKRQSASMSWFLAPQTGSQRRVRASGSPPAKCWARRMSATASSAACARFCAVIWICCLRASI